MNIQDDNTAVAERFRLIAQRFCSLVDSAATLDKTEFLVQLYRMLPELIGEAMRLPRAEIDDDEDEDEDQETSLDQSHTECRMDYEEWSQLYNALKEKLGDWNLYRQVFDPTKDTEAIYGSLADDIADIYRDLKEGIDRKECDSARPEDIIFGWRLLLYSHWGKHAIDALRTSHFLLEETLE